MIITTITTTEKDDRGTLKWASGRADVSQYVFDVAVGQGARWSRDRRRAWRLDEGRRGNKEIPLGEAARIARFLNLSVPPPDDGD